MGGSGGTSPSRTREEAEQARREVLRALEEQEQVAEVNAALGKYLAGINARDVELTRERLDAIVEALGGLVESIDKLLFGGSVAKHTYVDGLSDVDALVVVDADNASPADLRDRFARLLRGRLGTDGIESVHAGDLAVTIRYKDGSEIQLLPAVERDGRTSIASRDGTEWRQIRPRAFAKKLTEVNARLSGTAIPTIKLAKSLIAGLPKESRLSGYHVEAIAVDAFKDYTGKRDRASLLSHLIDHASVAVRRPIADLTGQSVHVDANLGPANSEKRKSISTSLARLATETSSLRSAQDVKTLFDL